MIVLTAGKGSQYLLWANVSLISNCEKYYGNRFHPGMMCAGWCVPVYKKAALNSTFYFVLVICMYVCVQAIWKAVWIPVRGTVVVL